LREPADIDVKRDGQEMCRITLAEGVAGHFPHLAFGTPEHWSFFVYPADEGTTVVGNRTHVALLAPSCKAVRQVYAAALGSGGAEIFTPRERPHICSTYFGAMFSDLDGHRIEVLTQGLSTDQRFAERCQPDAESVETAKYQAIGIARKVRTCRKVPGRNFSLKGSPLAFDAFAPRGPAPGHRRIPHPHFASYSMFRTLLKSKIHRATVTDCELHYEGSCAIDEDLLEAANLAENEQIHVWNINNGERFVTYAIRGQRGSGIISLNGSAARRASLGDLVIIAAFGLVPEDQVRSHQPKLVFVDGANRIKEERAHIPVQPASGEAVPA
jgi:aspartate 1-decarboxylase